MTIRGGSRKKIAKKIIPNLLAKNIALNEIGIITSSNSQIQHIAMFMKQEEIPFFIVKWSFENSAVVVWLQDCAQWCIEKETQSFEKLFDFWKKLIYNHNDPRKNKEDIYLKTIFYKVITSSLESKDCHEWLQHIIGKLELKNTLIESEIYPNEVDNLNRLLDEAKLRNLKDSKIKRFANLGSPENEVTITTRHSSKGLEFEAVILLGMEEGNFPYYLNLNNEIALNEDQRLCYVCISRAKKTCILLRSESFTKQTKWGVKTFSYAPSRFWISLHNKFGNGQNTFTKNNYK